LQGGRRRATAWPLLSAVRVRPTGSGAPRAWLPRIGFGARLGLATSLLVLVVCVTQSWFLARRDLDNVGRYLTDRGRGVSDRLARDAGPSIAAGNVDALHQLAEQVSAQDAVTYARFFDAGGLLLVSVGSVPGGTAPPVAQPDGAGPIPIGNDTWEFQTPVFIGLERVGVATVGISLEALEKIRRQTFTTAGAFTALFSLAAVLGALLLARAITRPLHVLAGAADTIARGDFATRVPVGSRDEVGALATSFNAMVESLADSRMSLEEKLAELERANRLKSEFLATISHELRTPLNVIIGYAEMLAEGDGRVGPEQREMIEAIRRYSQLQLDLITSILDFSRLSSGRISFHVRRFALGPVLVEIHALYAARLRGPRVRLTVAVDPRLPQLETDRTKLQEVVRNLVDNAVKFTEDGVIAVSASAIRSGWVRLEVADTGSGIDDAELHSVFDAFHQIGESSTRRTGGIGLGLSIVKQLVVALGGTISVASRLGEGSTFRVDLPCVLPVNGEAASPPAAEDILDDVARAAATLPAETGALRRPGRARGTRPAK
jgi:signal transduction histidine kinase